MSVNGGYLGPLLTILSIAFTAGGVAYMTQNHMKHLAKDIKRLLRGQRRLSKRVTRIERRMKYGQ